MSDQFIEKFVDELRAFAAGGFPIATSAASIIERMQKEIDELKAARAQQAGSGEAVVGDCESFDDVWDRAQDLRQQADELEKKK